MYSYFLTLGYTEAFQQQSLVEIEVIYGTSNSRNCTDTLKTQN